MRALLPRGLKKGFVVSGRPEGALPQMPVRSPKVPLAGEGTGGATCAEEAVTASRPVAANTPHVIILM